MDRKTNRPTVSSSDQRKVDYIGQIDDLRLDKGDYTYRWIDTVDSTVRPKDRAE